MKARDCPESWGRVNGFLTHPGNLPVVEPVFCERLTQRVSNIRVTFAAFFVLKYKNTTYTTMFRTTSMLFAAMLWLCTATLSAQTAPPKYGHMNLGNLLEELPDTKKADEELKKFTEAFATKDDSLTKAFTADYTKLEQEYNAGLLTPVQAQQRQAELQKRQEDIQKFEQDAQKQIAARREELLKPILTRVDEAVRTVAKENGYAMIFDTSTGVMLFAADTEDVTPLVKKKLGL